MSEKTRILFISRAYPPILGGIENQNYEIAKALSEIAEVKIIANKKGRIFLPFFAPYALIKALLLFRKYDVLLLGDGVLGIIGWILKIFYKKPVISIVHGLDLTYKMPLYQKLWIGFFIKKLDKLIAVGNQTIKEGVARKMPEEKFVFIPNGVDTEKFKRDKTRDISNLVIKEKSSERKIILTLGRLAKRKGVTWFINNVMRQLDKNIIYVVAGEGKDKRAIEKAVKKNDLQNRIKLLGNISNEEKLKLYNNVDVFIQPNIEVKGDMEGFGLVVLEAASCELPVVASNLEGLKDAIQNGQNGFLVKPYDSESYKKKIEYLLNDDGFRKKFGQRARKYTIENYSWEKIAGRYLEEIGKVISNR
ncbi:glycosyltransferase family 4 protein [bacterium]|nr:glycosyltransferase family 4 protein [bacterium]